MKAKTSLIVAENSQNGWMDNAHCQSESSRDWSGNRKGLTVVHLVSNGIEIKKKTTNAAQVLLHSTLYLGPYYLFG